MKYRHLQVWITVTVTLAVIAIVIRSIWQIVVIPTQGTMIIFIPLILALLGGDALVAYLAWNPQQLRSLPALIGISTVLTAGLIAGVSHFAHFIPSPEAAHPLSKVIGAFVLLSSLSAYSLALWFLWSLRRPARRG